MIEPVVILANQRSGTVGLGLGLEQAFGVSWVGEIFHSNFLGRKNPSNRDFSNSSVNFFKFKSKLVEENPILSLPSEENQENLFGRYLNFVEKLVAAETVIFDVKYNSWHHLNGYWSMPGQMPGLGVILKKRAIPIVHLIRENLFEQYCSQLIAIQSGKWHVKIEDDYSPPRVHIDPKQCEARLNSIQEARDWYNAKFGGYRKFSTISYEEIFVGNKLSEKCVGMFSEILGSDPISNDELPIKKSIVSLSNLVENKEEVQEYFAGSRFEDMVVSAMSI